MLSPYSLDYAARISVILLPWAALPWLLGLLIRSLREGGWWHAAWFALIVQVVGGVNVTALVFAGIAPLLWLVHAVFVTARDAAQRAVGAVIRIGALTVVGVVMVDGGTLGAGLLRRQHLEVHRDPARGQPDLRTERGTARPRLLVLLRARQVGALDRGEHGLHATACGHSHQLRHPSAGARECRLHHLALPQLLRLTGDGRCGHRGRGVSLRQPVQPGCVVQGGGHDLEGSLRPAKYWPRARLSWYWGWPDSSPRE